ncbi:LamG-like jellyroll fold domain-containing protein [Roseibacillus persicicus]|uniref:LamG-like jellyroll fold domain-containing protein n=1 Tax=Roseibacillus persicicus TaxID=454148 RepID=UPI00398A64D0
MTMVFRATFHFGFFLLCCCLQAEAVDYKRWMTDNVSTIGAYKLRDLVIPGTHDSGSYDPLSPVDFGDARWDEFSVGDHFPPDDYDNPWKRALAITDELYEPWSQNHNKTILQQMNEGVRSIDLRVAVNADGVMYFAHGLYNDTIEKCLDDAETFHDQNPNEIIMIYFQKFYDTWLDENKDSSTDYEDGMRASKHEELVAMINARFAGDIASYENFTPSSTVSDLINAGKTVIISYQVSEADYWDISTFDGDAYITSDPEWERPVEFWPGYQGYGRSGGDQDSHHRSVYYDGLIEKMLPSDSSADYYSDEDELFTFGNVTHNNTLIANGTLGFGSYPRSIREVAEDANPVLMHWLVTELAVPPPAGANYRYKGRPNVIGIDFQEYGDIVDVCLELNGISTGSGVLAKYATEPESDWNEGWQSGPEIALEWVEGALSDTGDWFEDAGDQIADWFVGAGNDFVDFFDDLFSSSDPAPPTLRSNFVTAKNGTAPTGQIPTGIRHYQIEVEWIDGGSTPIIPLVTGQIYFPDFTKIPSNPSIDDLSWTRENPIGNLNQGANHFLFDAEWPWWGQWEASSVGTKDFYISEEYFPHSVLPVLYFSSEYISGGKSWTAWSYQFMTLPEEIGSCWEGYSQSLANGARMKYCVTRIRAGEPKEVPNVVWEPALCYTGEPLGGGVRGVLNARTEPFVPGTFDYAQVESSTVLPDGDYELLVRFVPDDTERYATVSETVEISIGPKPLLVPVIEWFPSTKIYNLADWPYGDAQAKVNGNTIPGTWSYTPKLGEYPASALDGFSPLAFRVAVFTPDDPTTYASASAIAEYKMKLEQLPFHGEPVSLPGIIETGEHDTGGWLIAYSKRYGFSGTDEVVQNFGNGDWIEYTVEAEHPGHFDIKVLAGSTASESPTFQITRDEGQVVLANNQSVKVSHNAAWNEVVMKDVFLPAGVHVLRFENTSQGAEYLSFDFQNLEFAQTSYSNSDVTAPGDLSVASSSNSPSGEEVANAIDNDIETKYLNFDGEGSGFTVTPEHAWTKVAGIALTSANDSPNRDPKRVVVEGTADGTNFVTLVDAVVPAFTERFQRQEIEIVNAVSYQSYRITFPEIVDPSVENYMQIAEVELIGVPSDPGPLLEIEGQSFDFGGVPATYFYLQADTTILPVTGEFWLVNRGERDATVSAINQTFGSVNWSGGVIAPGERQKVQITYDDAADLRFFYVIEVVSDSIQAVPKVRVSSPEGVVTASTDFDDLIEEVDDGEVIRFSQELNGKVKRLSQVWLEKEITLDASNLSEGVTLEVTGEGRAFMVRPNGGLTLRGLNLTGGNVESGWGGAVMANGPVLIENCAIFGNEAQYGGGVACDTGGSLTMRNVTLFRNRSTVSGGAVFHANGSVEAPVLLENCTISGNWAGTNGGGIDPNEIAQNTTLVNCIVSGNFANSGANIYGAADLQESNLVDGEAGLSIPGFYGGSTATIPLHAGSPAIDAAVSGVIPEFDQSGLARVGVPDLGAAEYQPLDIVSIEKAPSYTSSEPMMEVTLKTVPNSQYQLETSADLENFSVLEDSVALADGDLTMWEVELPVDSGFVRARQFSGLSQGLRAYWNFEGNGNNSVLASGDVANDLPLNGVAQGDVSYFDNGLGGQAALFDGNGDHFQVDGEIVEDAPDSSFTISSWFRSDVLPTGSEVQFVYETSINQSMSLSLREGIYAGSTDTELTLLQFRSHDGTTVTLQKTLYDHYFDGKWMHAAVTFDADSDTFLLYLNGEQVSSQSEVGNITDFANFRIGSSRTADWGWFKGAIDEVGVWDRAFTQVEVSLLYNGGIVTSVLD